MRGRQKLQTEHLTLIQTSDTLSSPPPPAYLPSILPSRHKLLQINLQNIDLRSEGGGVGGEVHDCGRILIRTGRSSSLLYTLRSSYLHNWLMFLCEVGMNNTLVGLLHPQADEKMFNFSKCSAPASFSLSFSLPGYLWALLVCLWVFGGVALICFFRVYSQLRVHVQHHKQRQHLHL